MNATKLESVQCVKDFGIRTASSLNFSQQCKRAKDATGKVNRMPGIITEISRLTIKT